MSSMLTSRFLDFCFFQWTRSIGKKTIALSLFSCNCILTHRSLVNAQFRGGGAFWNIGGRWGGGLGSSSLTKKNKRSAYIYTRSFQNVFRCSFTQRNVFVISTVFNVPLIDLGKCSMVLLRMVFCLRSSRRHQCHRLCQINHNNLLCFGDRSFVESLPNSSHNGNLTYFGKITKRNILSNHTAPTIFSATKRGRCCWGIPPNFRLLPPPLLCRLCSFSSC